MKAHILFSLFLLALFCGRTGLAQGQMTAAERREVDSIMMHDVEYVLKGEMFDSTRFGEAMLLLGERNYWIDLDMAIRYYEYALRLLPDKQYQTKITKELSDLYLYTNQYEQAIHYLKQYIALSGEESEKDYLAVGNIYRQMGQPDSAIYYLTRCEEAPETRIAASFILSELYNEIGDEVKALDYKRRHERYSNFLHLDKYHAEKSTEKAKQENETLRSQWEWSLRQNRFVTSAIALTLLLLLIVGYCYYHRLSARNRLQLQLAEQQMAGTIIEKNRLIEEVEQYSLKNRLLEQQMNLLKQQPQNEWSWKNSVIHRLLHTPYYLNEEEWKELIEFVDATHSRFISRLEELHPQLTSNDIRYCCLFRLSFSLQEIAAIMGISTRSVSQWKHRAKVKLAVDAAKLETYLRSF